MKFGWGISNFFSQKVPLADARSTIWEKSFQSPPSQPRLDLAIIKISPSEIPAESRRGFPHLGHTMASSVQTRLFPAGERGKEISVALRSKATSVF